MRMKIAEGRRILRGTVNKTNTSSLEKKKGRADEMEQNLSKMIESTEGVLDVSGSGYIKYLA